MVVSFGKTTSQVTVIKLRVLVELRWSGTVKFRYDKVNEKFSLYLRRSARSSFGVNKTSSNGNSARLQRYKNFANISIYGNVRVTFPALSVSRTGVPRDEFCVRKTTFCRHEVSSLILACRDYILALPYPRCYAFTIQLELTGL